MCLRLCEHHASVVEGAVFRNFGLLAAVQQVLDQQ